MPCLPAVGTSAWTGGNRRVKRQKASVHTGAANCRYRLAVSSCRRLGKLRFRGLLFCLVWSSVPVWSLLRYRCFWSSDLCLLSLAACSRGTTLGPLAGLGCFFKTWDSRTWRLGTRGCARVPTSWPSQLIMETARCCKEDSANQVTKGDSNNIKTSRFLQQWFSHSFDLQAFINLPMETGA